mgnify:CR=1 FL=1
MVIITHEEGLIKTMFHMVWIRMVSIRRVKIITIVVGDFVSFVVVVVNLLQLLLKSQRS